MLQKEDCRYSLSYLTCISKVLAGLATQDHAHMIPLFIRGCALRYCDKMNDPSVRKPFGTSNYASGRKLYFMSIRSTERFRPDLSQPPSIEL